MTAKQAPMHEVTIYTDGSCSPNPGQGGYAAILVSGDREKVITGTKPDTTNYRMELMAVVAGLEALKHPAQVTVVSDNNNVVQGAMNWLDGWIASGWRNSRNDPIQHRDLWERIHSAMQTHAVTVVKVQAHVAANEASTAEQMNNRADRLATAARSPDTTDAPGYRLYVAGSRRASTNMLMYARRVVTRAIQNGWTIVVGDNPQGVDNAVVQEASRLAYQDVIVVGIAAQPRNGGVPGGQYIRYGNTYRDRDRAMARASDRGLFIWDGKSHGTREAHDYMKARRRTVHLMDFSGTFQTDV